MNSKNIAKSRLSFLPPLSNNQCASKSKRFDLVSVFLNFGSNAMKKRSLCGGIPSLKVCIMEALCNASIISKIFVLLFTLITSSVFAESEILNLSNSDSWASVDKTSDLNPSNDYKLEISTIVNFKELPSGRIYLISKLDPINHPYPGWAIGIRNINGSYYPQVYYKDGWDKGGWHTFSSYDLKINRDYRIFVIISGSDYISFYISELGNEEVSSKFLGGIGIEKYKIPINKSDIVIGSSSFKSGVLGKIKEISVEKTKKRKSQYYPENVLKFLSNSEDFIDTKFSDKDTGLKYHYLERQMNENFKLKGGATWLGSN